MLSISAHVALYTCLFSTSSDCTIALLAKSATLDPVTVDTRRLFTSKLAASRTVSAIEVDVFNVKGVDVAGKV